MGFTFNHAINWKNKGYYNGWQHDQFVTNLLMFSVCGRKIACVMNVPESVHDSTLALWGGVYDVLEQAYACTGGKCCVDSAFAALNAHSLIRSSDNTTKVRTAHEMIQLHKATLLRQSIRMGNASNPIFYAKVVLPYSIRTCEPEPEETGYDRNRMFYCVEVGTAAIQLSRPEFVGLNQLRNTYIPNWSKDCDYFIKENN
jgi:hypothetical protein